MIIDDCYLVIGLLNLSNCLMMLDIEVDVVMFGDIDSNCKCIVFICDDLIVEYIGCDIEIIELIMGGSYIVNEFMNN